MGGVVIAKGVSGFRNVLSQKTNSIPRISGTVELCVPGSPTGRDFKGETIEVPETGLSSCHARCWFLWEPAAKQHKKYCNSKGITATLNLANTCTCDWSVCCPLPVAVMLKYIKTFSLLKPGRFLSSLS